MDKVVGHAVHKGKWKANKVYMYVARSLPDCVKKITKLKKRPGPNKGL
jgi:hypothetical protein